MHWPRVLKGLQVLARSVTVMPLFPRAFVSAPLRLELRERTEPGELGRAVLESAPDILPWVAEAPAPLPGPGPPPTPDGLPAPAGRPPCAYADEPRKDSVARAKNGTNTRFIALFLLSENEMDCRKLGPGSDRLRNRRYSERRAVADRPS